MNVFDKALLFGNPLDPYAFKGVGECASNSDIITHFHTPVTTATSVLGIAFNDGVVIAADLLASYGSLARFKNCPRILKVNKNTVIGVGGDYADYQYLKELINGKIIGEECLEDDIYIKPASLHCWLTRVMYNRRSKVDPLWNNIIVGGIQEGKPFLGSVDKLGTAFEDKIIATGYGAYIAIPLLRDAVDKKPELNAQEATEILKKCMEVLYYRDARSWNKYEMAVITSTSCEVQGPIEIKADWNIAHKIV
ncbi:proteasome subunit beta type-4 [Planococcus citri]|uniref:proteasome subunit beta type-4 n=1 Tax=Planococcus citri TaxID=170843 RepID=UPI0031F8D83F